MASTQPQMHVSPMICYDHVLSTIEPQVLEASNRANILRASFQASNRPPFFLKQNLGVIDSHVAAVLRSWLRPRNVTFIKVFGGHVPSLLRSYSQHSALQVPVGPNGSRYPLGDRSPAYPCFRWEKGKGEVKLPNTIQHASQGSADT